jgi:hypothetical protein
MRTFEQYCVENDLFDDMFADSAERVRKRGKKVKKDRKTEPYSFELYRGFDADLDSLEKQGENFILSPKQSEQGMMWFTHHFITGYDAKEYVSGRGEWLLTYPLQAMKHYDNITYEDGSVEPRAPDELVDKVRSIENSTWSCFGTYCLELPKGWYWSYKSEKFIATSNKVAVHPSMIRKNQ